MTQAFVDPAIMAREEKAESWSPFQLIGELGLLGFVAAILVIANQDAGLLLNMATSLNQNTLFFALITLLLVIVVVNLVPQWMRR